MPISDRERERAEAILDAIYEQACQARREALRDPRAWAEQIRQMLQLMLRIQITMLVLACVVGIVIGRSSLSVFVGFSAAAVVAPFVPWPNVFRDRFNSVIDQAID